MCNLYFDVIITVGYRVCSLHFSNESSWFDYSELKYVRTYTSRTNVYKSSNGQINNSFTNGCPPDLLFTFRVREENPSHSARNRGTNRVFEKKI